jgi:hypothetical protein
MTKIVSLINQSVESSTVSAIRDKADGYNSLPGMTDPVRKVRKILHKLSEDLDKELIVFFDEADCLSGDGLIPFLAQI